MEPITGWSLGAKIVATATAVVTLGGAYGVVKSAWKAPALEVAEDLEEHEQEAERRWDAHDAQFRAIYEMGQLQLGMQNDMRNELRAMRAREEE